MEISVQNLCKSYGRREALKGVSFSLTPGIYGLLGPNGAGKSTLIGILTGNLKADSGDVFLNGEDIRKMGAAYRKILGYMPQQQALYPSFTVTGFLDYMAALKGMDKSAARIQIPEVLEEVELSEYGKSKIKTLSGGMKQRLMIAQAILNDPDFIILDEPTAGLDPKQRITIRNLISRIAVNKIVLLATHVVSDVEFIAKELILLKEGMILRKAGKEEILRSMQGYVYEAQISIEQYKSLPDSWRIAGVSQIGEKVFVRVITEHPEAAQDCAEVRPTLEDVYLCYFGG